MRVLFHQHCEKIVTFLICTKQHGPLIIYELITVDLITFRKRRKFVNGFRSTEETGHYEVCPSVIRQS